MSYGLQVLGPSGYTILDTSLAMEGTVVVAAGTGTQVSYNAKDILALKKTVASGSYVWVAAQRTLSNGIYTMYFGDAIAATSVSVDYVILRVTNDVTPTGTYGHVTYAPDGSTRTFDSRLFANTTGSFNITNVAPGGSYYGAAGGVTLDLYSEYEYYACNWFWNYNLTNLVYQQGLQFSNNHSTYGSTVRFRSYLNIFGAVSYPDLTSGTFWGQFI